MSIVYISQWSIELLNTQDVQTQFLDEFMAETN